MQVKLQDLFPGADLTNDNALAGVVVDRKPARIYWEGNQFLYKDDSGQEKLMSMGTLQCVIINTRPMLMRAWSAIDSENGPDCISMDCVEPTEDSPLKQANECKECMVKIQCHKYKVLALLISGRIYEFWVPEPSFCHYYDYVQNLTQDGVILAICHTVIKISSRNLIKFWKKSVMDEKECINTLRWIDDPDTRSITKTSPVLDGIKHLPPPAVSIKPSTEDTLLRSTLKLDL